MLSILLFSHIYDLQYSRLKMFTTIIRFNDLQHFYCRDLFYIQKYNTMIMF